MASQKPMCKGGWAILGLCLRGDAYSVVRLDEGVVHGDNVDVVVLDSIAEDDTANATESVDTNLRRRVSDCLLAQRGSGRSLP